MRLPIVAALAGAALVAGCAQATSSGESTVAASSTATAATSPTAAPLSSAPPTATAAPPASSAPVEPVAPPVPPAPPAPPATAAVAVTDVIDGDTIDTTVGRIRVIGIDTPERGECNFGPATSLLSRLIAESGNQVVLTAAPGKDDVDRYGRLLRYIDTPSGQDLGRELIAAGLAIARYDSRDGYGAHPRESDYVALDAATAQVPCPGQ